MALPATGAITMAQVATELGITSVGINLNQANVRGLAQKTSGAIAMSDLYGKSAVKAMTLNLVHKYYILEPEHYSSNLSVPTQAIESTAANTTNIDMHPKIGMVHSTLYIRQHFAGVPVVYVEFPGIVPVGNYVARFNNELNVTLSIINGNTLVAALNAASFKAITGIDWSQHRVDWRRVGWRSSVTMSWVT